MPDHNDGSALLPDSAWTQNSRDAVLGHAKPAPLVTQVQVWETIWTSLGKERRCRVVPPFEPAYTKWLTENEYDRLMATPGAVDVPMTTVVDRLK
jgi:hypothetical protein